MTQYGIYRNWKLFRLDKTPWAPGQNCQTLVPFIARQMSVSVAYIYQFSCTSRSLLNYSQFNLLSTLRLGNNEIYVYHKFTVYELLNITT